MGIWIIGLIHNSRVAGGGNTVVSSGEVLVVGAELLVHVVVVEVAIGRLSVAGESTAMTLSWERFPSSCS